MTITEERFEDIYMPRQNHLDENASFNGSMYETYGEEVEYVQSMIESNKVWTVLDGDDGELFISAGYWRVNRMGYIITEISHEGESIEVELD